MPNSSSSGRTTELLGLIAGTALLKGTLQQAEPMPSYLWYIPRRLGLSEVLDTAVDLVFTAASHLLLPSDEDRMLGLIKKYGKALTYLRHAIEDPVASLSADTLAAVALLASWEVSTTSMPFLHGSWLTLCSVSIPHPYPRG